MVKPCGIAPLIFHDRALRPDIENVWDISVPTVPVVLVEGVAEKTVSGGATSPVTLIDIGYRFLSVSPLLFVDPNA